MGIICPLMVAPVIGILIVIERDLKWTIRRHHENLLIFYITGYQFHRRHFNLVMINPYIAIHHHGIIT